MIPLKTADPVRCEAGPQTGDVVIERLDDPKDAHAVGVVSKPPQIRCASYREALARAAEFAKKEGVDIWAAAMPNHFVLIARHRAAARGTRIGRT